MAPSEVQAIGERRRDLSNTGAHLVVSTQSGLLTRRRARRLFRLGSADPVTLTRVELSTDTSSAVVTTDTEENFADIPVRELPTLLENLHTDVATVRLPARSTSVLPSPSSRSHAPTLVSALLTSGIDVAVLVPEEQSCTNIAEQHIDATTSIEIRDTQHSVDIGRLLRMDADAVAPHLGWLTEVIGGNVSLAITVRDLLPPWSGPDAIPLEVIQDAVGQGLVEQILGLATDDRELACAVLYVALGPAAFYDSRLDPDEWRSMRRSVDTLTRTGIRGGGRSTREVLTLGLRSVVPEDVLAGILRQVPELLGRLDCTHEDTLKVLEMLDAGRSVTAVGVIHQVLRLADAVEHTVAAEALLPLLHETPERAIDAASMVMGHRVDVAGLLLDFAARCPGLADPMSHTSLLVALEYPTLARRWALRALTLPDRDSSTWITATAVALLTHGAVDASDEEPASVHELVRACPDDALAAERRADVESLLAAFTLRAREDDITAIAAGAVNLEIDGWQCQIGVLIAAACLAIDDLPLAERWSWLVRARCRGGTIDRGGALLAKAFCDGAHGDFERRLASLRAALTCFVEARATALQILTRQAIEVLSTDPTDEAGSGHPRPEEDAHPVVTAIHLYLSILADLRRGGTGTTRHINVLFEVARHLRRVHLDNPEIIEWQQLLVELCRRHDENAIADCIQAGLSRDLETWAHQNPRSAAARAHRGPGELPSRAADETDLSDLSASEMKVVERVVAGDTNAQAAEALFLSKRTVDTHLRNIYRRLGISSRSQLKALAGEFAAHSTSHIDALEPESA